MAIITISRGSLSGGRAVAECLANELGYHCVAREIVRGAARRIGVSEDAVKEKFETAPGLWSQLFRERKLYVAAVQTALADRCVEGNLVYHGLAGQFLLRGLPGVLRVRLVAPLEFRIRALLSERDHLSREAAEKFIDNIDQERSRRVRRMYDMDVEDPALYDLTVNLRIMSEGSACAAIGEAARQPEYEITPEVKAELEAFAADCHERLDAMLEES